MRTISTLIVFNKIAKILGGHASAIFKSDCFMLARRDIVGYAGGSWQAVNVGPVGVYVPPAGSRVTLHCPGLMRDVETDQISAGAGIALVALNYLCWRYADGPSANPIAYQAAVDLYEATRDAVYSTTTLDHASIATYLD